MDLLLDANGRQSRTKSWSFAETRVLGSRGIQTRRLEPASCLGDVGGATVPLYLGLSSLLTRRHASIGITHSVSEAAAAVVVGFEESS